MAVDDRIGYLESRTAADVDQCNREADAGRRTSPISSSYASCVPAPADKQCTEVGFSNPIKSVTPTAR
ncbi:hypothetical protein Trco_005421 [Trichoderma cornu-damae]|uniref:Uncharacterized protein n=1 Tax=Trichoderma cornu-damae TaxID=654480 RepID=A0A9P8QP82_9HYPO|nr:hypothetical protein Trco_005421 [Trichoderma cornu-damae]